MVTQIEIPLSGRKFERAVSLSKELATAALLGGGPGWEAALEPMLTEMANDRVVGALTGLVLTSLVAATATSATQAELALEGRAHPSIEEIAMRSVSLIEEALDDLRDITAGTYEPTGGTTSRHPEPIPE